MLAASQDRHPGSACQLPGGCFVAKLLEQFWPRPDKGDPRIAAGPGKRGVFREKAVAWVDPVDAVLDGHRDDRLDIEVTPQRLAWPTR